MKSFQDYLNEADVYVNGPVEGDTVDIEFTVDEGVSTYVLESTNESVTLYADDTLMSLLESQGYIEEKIQRYGPAGSNNSIGYSLEENDIAEGAMKDKDIELQDYNRMSPQQFFASYGMKKTDWALKNSDLLKNQQIDWSGSSPWDFVKETSRMLELAGCKRMEEDQAADVLAKKELATAITNPMPGVHEEENVQEGVMSEIDIDLHEIARNEDYDRLYDLLTASSATGQFVQDMYYDVARDYGLHPDDDNDVILDRLMDRISDDYGDPDFDPAEQMDEAEYQGRKVPLGKPMRGDVKKFKVYVKDPKTGNVKKVNFGHGGTSAKRAGQKTMKIKKSDPARRRSFRARHNCDNPGPRTKARYWSCRAW